MILIIYIGKQEPHHFALFIKTGLANIPCSTNTVKARVILAYLYFDFSLVFYILRAFLIKQLFHSITANSALFIVLSHIQRALVE